MELLEQHFDIAFSAPDGIIKLRGLILTLAMQGKLVEQDPNDPPASQLLKEIEAEKNRLVKKNKLKAPKPQSEIKAEEVPYLLPDRWEWVRFGEIAQHNSGKTLDKGRNTGLPRDYITTSNLYWGRFELGSVRQMLIREEELEKCTAKENDPLICEGGEAGRAAVWNYDSEVCFQNHVHRARFYGDVDPYFAYRFFEKLNATGEINQHRKGVGISNMSSKSLATIIFPLPPLPEQHRIVAKIDQLMARCDELEKLRTEREQKRRSVHTAALKKLLDAQVGGTFTDAWQFITQNFGELCAVLENIAELRKAILQLAVMGKLVQQNPNDPPTSQLLKEIDAEKKQLMKEGKIKAPKPMPEIKPDEMPYALPQGWEWVRLGDLGISQTGTTPPSKDQENYGNHIPFIGPGDIKNNEITYTGGGLSEIGIAKGRLIAKESVLMVCIGGSIGKHAVNDRDVTCNQQINTLTPYGNVSVSYLFYSMGAEWFQKCVVAQAGGSATPIINKQKWSSILIPVSPALEQRRIVAKIDQLMAVCDTLEQQIDAATGKKTELLNAVMAQV